MSTLSPPSKGLSVWKPAAYYLSLFVLLAGGIFYIVHTYFAIEFSVRFPAGSKLEISVWCMWMSIRLVAIWLPFILILSRIETKSKIVWTVYFVGCVLGLVLATIAVIYIEDYKKEGEVRKEYMKLVGNSIKNGHLPRAVLYVVKSGEKCSGWTGPLDFIEFNNSHLQGNVEYLKELAIVFGNVIQFDSESSTLVAGTVPISKLPKGCGKYFKKLFKINCLLVFWTTIVASFLYLVFMVMAIMLIKDKGEWEDEEQDDVDQKQVPTAPQPPNPAPVTFPVSQQARPPYINQQYQYTQRQYQPLQQYQKPQPNLQLQYQQYSQPQYQPQLQYQQQYQQPQYQQQYQEPQYQQPQYQQPQHQQYYQQYQQPQYQYQRQYQQPQYQQQYQQYQQQPR